MDPRIILLVPHTAAKLAAEVDYYAGAIDGVVPEDADQAAAILNGRVGQFVEIVFPFPVDPQDLPSDAVEAAAKATNGGYYLYLVDAFTEQPTGVKVQGRIVFRAGGRERKLDIPWQHGEPRLNMATLTACGMAANEADAVLALFSASLHQNL